MINIPQHLTERVAAAVSRFGARVKPNQRRKTGGPEDQLRAPLEQLLGEVAEALGVELVLVGETSLAALGVRPDYAANVSGSRVGYVEVKAPGRGVPTTWRPNSHERRQWDQMRLLPNVLYTDGTQYAAFRSGELTGRVARLNGDLRHAGPHLVPDGDHFVQVVSDFLLWKPDPPLTISQLVNSAAKLCRLLRGEVADTLARERAGQEPSAVFTGLADDWRKLLFPDLSDAQFADAYAQTITFALLLARVDGIAFDDRPLSEIARQLGKKHSLMGKALSVLTEETVGAEHRYRNHASSVRSHRLGTPEQGKGRHLSPPV